MPMDFHNDRSRSSLRAKRRKTNIILNTLIAIVIILILIVGGSIFFGGSDPAQEQVGSSAKTEPKNESTVSKQEPVNEPDKETAAKEDKNEESKEIIEKESDEPNVEKVIVDPAWKPIGTEQVNGHQSSFNMGTVDWNEKLKAAAYATDIPVDNMTAWWVTGGADPNNQAVLTVSAKGSDDTYRVHIEWVDGEGWKPTEVKKLVHNDKK